MDSNSALDPSQPPAAATQQCSQAQLSGYAIGATPPSGTWFSGYTPEATPPIGAWFPSSSNSAAADAGVSPRLAFRPTSNIGFDPGYTTPIRKRTGRSRSATSADVGRTVRRDHYLRNVDLGKNTMTCVTDRDTTPIISGDEIQTASPSDPNYAASQGDGQKPPFLQSLVNVAQRILNKSRSPARSNAEDAQAVGASPRSHAASLSPIPPAHSSGGSHRSLSEQAMSRTPGFGDTEPRRQTLEHVEHTIYGQRSSAESLGTQDSPGDVVAHEVPIGAGHSLDDIQTEAQGSRGDDAPPNREHSALRRSSGSAPPSERFAHSVQRLVIPDNGTSPRTPKRSNATDGAGLSDAGGGKYQCTKPRLPYHTLTLPSNYQRPDMTLIPTRQRPTSV